MTYQEQTLFDVLPIEDETPGGDIYITSLPEACAACPCCRFWNIKNGRMLQCRQLSALKKKSPAILAEKLAGKRRDDCPLLTLKEY